MPRTISVEIRPTLPSALRRLEELAGDLYFTCEHEVQRLFRFLDEDCWAACGQNPKVFLRRIAQEKLEAAASNPVLLAEYRQVLSSYDTFMEQSAQGEVRKYLDPRRDLVAYFSAEYGFHVSIPIYAGGLGILSGDYLKSMSSLHVPFVGVGMLYHQGYFTQRILSDGEQRAEYPYIDPADLPVLPALDARGDEVRVHVELPGRQVRLRVWRAHVGHVHLYLLDSDLPENSAEDRKITYHLYDGDSETRLRQEMIFGIGGRRALRALGLSPTVWHLNEGHAAFLIIERCLDYVSLGMDLDTALERVAANTVFTTHTPVPAGHDVFQREPVLGHFRDSLARLHISEDHFLSLGASPHSGHGFNMTALALRGSRYHNGVSRIHGEVAARMEAHLWPQIPAEENPIGHVTNGVYSCSMLGVSWMALLDMYMGRGWRSRMTDEAFWHGFIERIPDHVYLSTRQILKAQMIEFVRERMTLSHRRNGLSESAITHLTRFLTHASINTLFIGFARRFATYKRADLLFHDLPRLARIVNDTERPVVILFAGKAHPADRPGQDLLRHIHQIGMRPEFQGRVMILEDYNLAMAHQLLPGVDVWLNNPEYPLEACGTSGMKAAINGAVNLSVLDGWWAEAYDGTNGWAISPHPELPPPERQRREATELLDLIEHQVVPLFYSRNASGEPEAWVKKSKASMKTVLPRYNSIRMSMDYLRDIYAPAIRHCDSLSLDAGRGASELAAWKKRVAAAWSGVSLRLAGDPPQSIRAGASLPLRVAARLNGLEPADVVVECLTGRESEVGNFCAQGAVVMEVLESDAAGETVFAIDLQGHPELPLVGLRQFRVRIYPHHPLLAHRFECGCMIWL